MTRKAVLYAIAALILGPPIAGIFGGPIGMIVAGVIGLGVLIAAIRRKDDDEDEFVETRLFNGAIPDPDHANGLQRRPSISGEILSVYWTKAIDASGDPEPRNGNFVVKMKLVNHEDVSCTIDKYWLTLTIGGHERRLLGYPSKVGRLRYRRPYDNVEVATEIHPLAIDYNSPLKRALALEGYVTFYVIECDIADSSASYWLIKKMKMAVIDALGNHHVISNSSATVFPATMELVDNIKPNLSLTCGMTQAAYDSQSGIWTEHLKLDSRPSTAFLLHITNSELGIDANGIRAQIEWTFDTGVSGPSFCPAMWLNEPYGKVDLPIGWRRTLLVGIKTYMGYDVCGWMGYDNRRINASEQPNSHSEVVPTDGTMLVKVIGDTGDVLFEAKLDWRTDLRTFLPDIKMLS
jgi:hypothetical protein